jgi:hypothetical protein
MRRLVGTAGGKCGLRNIVAVPRPVPRGLHGKHDYAILVPSNRSAWVAIHGYERMLQAFHTGGSPHLARSVVQLGPLGTSPTIEQRH